MSKKEHMLKLLRSHVTDEDLIGMIAHLRGYLDVDLLSKKNQYDITGEIVSGPEHVIYHASDYILTLEKENKRLREALEFYADEENYKAKGYSVYSFVENDFGYEARQALEQSK